MLGGEAEAGPAGFESQLAGKNDSPELHLHQ